MRLKAGETVVFEDETGFTLHPRLSRGWAKVGRRLRIPTTSQHQKRLNVFGWVAPLLGRQGLVRSARGDRKGFLKTLRHLYRTLRRYKIWLYVDGARWHKGDAVDLFVKSHERLHLNYLPPYQPGLNMQERIWRRVRYESTTNQRFQEIDRIWNRVRSDTRRWSKKKVKQLCRIT